MTASVQGGVRDMGISPWSLRIALVVFVLMGMGAIYAEYARKADLAARGDYTYQLEQDHYIRSWQGNGGGREVCVPTFNGGCSWQALN